MHCKCVMRWRTKKKYIKRQQVIRFLSSLERRGSLVAHDEREREWDGKSEVSLKSRSPRTDAAAVRFPLVYGGRAGRSAGRAVVRYAIDLSWRVCLNLCEHVFFFVFFCFFFFLSLLLFFYSFSFSFQLAAWPDATSSTDTAIDPTNACEYIYSIYIYIHIYTIHSPPVCIYRYITFYQSLLPLYTPGARTTHLPQPHVCVCVWISLPEHHTHTQTICTQDSP